MRIVDLHTHTGPATYVGRRMSRRTGSPLGNPFKVRRGDPPGTCLAKYRAWLADRIRAREPAVMAALSDLDENSVIACWCVTLDGEAVFTSPEVCHAQVIAKAVRYLRGGNIGPLVG